MPEFWLYGEDKNEHICLSFGCMDVWTLPL